MKKIQKYLSLLLMVLLVAAAFAGCTKNQPQAGRALCR